MARPVAPQAFLLSFVGTFLTAVLTGLFCHFVLRFAWLESLLVGAVISSTDAASVFSILRSKNLNLKHGLASLLELESGSNDPVSYMLTVILLGLMGQGGSMSIPLLVVSQLFFGVLVGCVVAVGAVFLLRRVHLSDNGLDTIFVVAVALISYALASVLGGNGYLSVYLAGIILGNSPIRNKVPLVHFFDGVTGLMQILLFFLLGLLAFPSQLPQILLPSVLIALFLTFVSRPLAVFAILTPFRTPIREQLLAAWAGLRGAASIVFAILVTVSDASTSHDIFHIVFCVALLSVLFQGTLLPVVARRLRLVDDEESVLRTFSDYVDESERELVELPVPVGSPWAGLQLHEVALPEDSMVVLIEREQETLIPDGQTFIREGDRLIVSCQKYKNSDKVVLSEFPITEGHPWVNQCLSEVGHPGVLIVMIKREGEILLPKGDTRILQGDIMVVHD